MAVFTAKLLENKTFLLNGDTVTHLRAQEALISAPSGPILN
jgi:hypothetical protein